MSQPQPTAEWAMFVADINEKTARKPRTPKAAKPVNANDLTRQIVKFMRDQGAFATRLDSKGTFRADLQKFVPSQQVAGLPDAFGVFHGRAIFCEVKVGKDRLSEAQKATHQDLIHAGAYLFTTGSFDDFKDWWNLSVLPAIVLP